MKTETASQEDDVNPRERLALNRILSPQLPLPEFLKLTADLGMKMAEIRNDFAERGVLDGLSETQLKKALAETGVRIITINALYPFEHGKHLKANLEKLKGLIAEARKVSCPHIVMCPFNEAGDPRTQAQRSADLVAALNAYGPLLTDAGMVGLIEALGFERSALRTKRAALDGIARCHHPKAFALLHGEARHRGRRSDPGRRLRRPGQPRPGGRAPEGRMRGADLVRVLFPEDPRPARTRAEEGPPGERELPHRLIEAARGAKPWLTRSASSGRARSASSMRAGSTSGSAGRAWWR
ncbi:MAG: TIM barrel protein [Deltaproteobacteria bacterium]|nr:MAG: TIM barrel protein [Deltaproteobacteria bacterium]